MTDDREILRLYAQAKAWEEMTGLSGDCFRAVAAWKKHTPTTWTFLSARVQALQLEYEPPEERG